MHIKDPYPWPLYTIILLLVIVGPVAQVSTVYFSDDFATVDNWVYFAGEGTFTAGGLMNGTGIAYKASCPPFNLFKNTFEVDVANCSGSWAILLEALDGNILLLINDTQPGTTTGQMMDQYEVDGIILQVYGYADFEYLRFYQPEGTQRGGILGALENWLLQVVQPWHLHVAVAAFIVILAAAFVFGKRRR